MQPQVLLDPDHPGAAAWLVNLHSAGFEADRVTGKRRLHFHAAINIGNLRAGQLGFDPLPSRPPQTPPPPPCELSREVVGLWMRDLALPRPCVFTPSATLETVNVTATDHPRGILPGPAAVLLRLAASRQHVITDHAREAWRFGDKPAIEGVPDPWDPWAYLTAWMWSAWDAEDPRPAWQVAKARRKWVTIKQRWQRLQAVGYPRDYPAFSRMVRNW